MATDAIAYFIGGKIEPTGDRSPKANQLPEKRRSADRKDFTASGEPLLIKQNGEAKLVVQDVQSYEDTQQMLALLKILALGQKDIEWGKFKNAGESLAELDDLDRKEKIR